MCQGVHGCSMPLSLVEFLSLHTRKGLHLCFSPAHLAGVACTSSLGLVCPQLVWGGEGESKCGWVYTAGVGYFGHTNRMRNACTHAHTRLPSPECDLHVTMSLYRNTGVWVLRPDKQNDDTYTHTHTHTHTHTMHAHTTHTHTHNTHITYTRTHNTHTSRTHTHNTHRHTHDCRNSLCSIAKVNILCIMATIGHSPPLLWIQNNCLPFGSSIHCPGVNVGCV